MRVPGGSNSTRCQAGFAGGVGGATGATCADAAGIKSAATAAESRALVSMMNGTHTEAGQQEYSLMNGTALSGQQARIAYFAR
jgi:hypothetical protein